MEIAAIDAEINEQIQRLQDLNKQMGEISKKIGALQEEGRALHGAALEVKGAIEGLAKLKVKEEEKLAKSKTAQLTLPEGVKPVLPEEPKAETPIQHDAAAGERSAAPVAETSVALEVK